MDLMALYDVLNCMSTALIAAQGGQQGIAEKAYLEASFAAGDAYPLNSPKSEALGLLLADVGATVTGRTA